MDYPTSEVASATVAASAAQRRMWFLDQLAPGRAVYHLALETRIDGGLDCWALAEALTFAIGRHDALATVFVERDGQLLRVAGALGGSIRVVNLEGNPDVEAAFAERRKSIACAPFDLGRGPLWRAEIVRLSKEEHVVLMCIHHIVADARSLAIVARDASRAYGRITGGELYTSPGPAPNFSEVLAAHAKTQTDARATELANYWRQRMAGIPAAIELFADHPRPAVQDFRGGALTVDLSADVVKRIEAIARQFRTSPFSILLTAFLIFLTRHCEGSDLVVGVPVIDTPEAVRMEAVGLFVDTLAFRADLAGATTFAEALQRTTSVLRADLAHQDMPFDRLVELLDTQREPAHNPVFQVLFAYRDEALEAGWNLQDCRVSSSFLDTGTSRVDLAFSLAKSGNSLRLRIEFSRSLFEVETARRMAERFLALVEDITVAPECRLSTLRRMSRAESLVSDTWSRGLATTPDLRPVHARVAAQAALTPDAAAVVDSATTLTYRELDEASDALANRLANASIGQGAVVGVLLDRTVETVVALLGIMKSGAAYLPLDPAYPRERLAFMVADSSAPLVVTRLALVGQAEGLGVPTFCVDASDVPTSTCSAVSSDPNALAYLIYTSGSTGQPKGARICHGNLATFLDAMNATFNDPPGAWLAVTSISFDISVLELLWTLTRGYRVVVRADEHTRESVLAASSAAAPAKKPLAVGLFFFGNSTEDAASVSARYRAVLDAARFADINGFSSVWTPERHFQAFGGIYPNPAVLAAALAMNTQRVGLRGGSVVLPLHETLNVVEDWALVDHLSGGRVGFAVASGWQPDDFVLAPDHYADRKARAFAGIEEIRALWRGERVKRTNGVGHTINVGVQPRPVQAELPLWITSARDPETFRTAGRLGTGLLTHLVGHSLDELVEKIGLYRQAWRAAGHPGRGHVTLMVHTFVGEDTNTVREIVREPLTSYVRSAFDLMSGFGSAFAVDLSQLPEDEVKELVDLAFERFFESSSLLGSVDTVVDRLDKVADADVDEVGCLVDFGVAPEEMLAALRPLAAARLAHVRRRRAKLPHERAEETLAAQIRREKVTHLQCTPSLAAVLVADPEARAALGGLKRLLVGGEALPPELADALAEAVGGTVHNMYGPTEATVWATTAPVVHGERATIGRPLPGYLAQVIDAGLAPCPIGLPGELLIGGPAIADGYHARPELTTERFIAAPDGQRLYRTGDRVRWRTDGSLEFLGRFDHQVKLAGRRIELGEIEAALAAFPGIGRVVCDVRGEGNGRRIVAYYVLDGRADAPAAQVLSNHLAALLPSYMIPATYASISAFPLTPNGKIDRKALPDPEAGPSVALAPSRSAGTLEDTIAAVWGEVLKRPEVSRSQSFFALGGNSVLLMSVRNRLRKNLGESFSLVDLFRHPTISSFAAHLKSRGIHTPIQSGASGGERRENAHDRL